MTSGANRCADVTLAVLAGGEGSRMGKAKGDLVLDGRPILEFLLKHLNWPGPTMLVTAPGREKPPGCELFDREVRDPERGLGPLRGILTAIQHAKSQVLAVVTVDMPGIGRAQLDWLIDRFRGRPDAWGLLCRCGDRIEPFPSVYRIEAENVIRQQLIVGKGSVAALRRLAEFAVVATPLNWDARIWTNLNTPGDLKTFLASRV